MIGILGYTDNLQPAVDGIQRGRMVSKLSIILLVNYHRGVNFTPNCPMNVLRYFMIHVEKFM